MKYAPDYSSRFRILKGGKISLVVSALVAGSTMTFASPTGGQVTTGSAAISQNGAVTTINQSTDKASINWQSFNIASHETVNFVQPSASSVTLNRVVGTSNSLIQGAMNANGQVFLINPNGVLFANGSSVNVGGLVASTLNITDANFQAGNYVFEGNSQNSVLNMGTITTAQGGYVAMMGKTVQNEGTIVATMGNVQMASGEKISLNLNGNSLVKLTIDQGTLNALVENKGLIKADGGQVYLTTQALNTILDGMVNNTGVIEAQSLNNVDGKIVLFAHGGTANIGGTIKAEGGFVETSGKEFAIQPNATIKAGEWLIDPVNITIDNTLATAIETGLASGSVTITTDGSNTPSTVSGESGTDGDINVNSAISWSSNNTLTLSAYNDININENITHTGTSAGGAIFLYGQGTADGGTSAYTLANTKAVTSPSLQWRKGSDLASTRYAIVNGDVFLGGKYIEIGISINEGGQFGTYGAKPSLFFGRQGGRTGIGMIGDADGFGTGQNIAIDYFLPGSDWEQYSVAFNGADQGSSSGAPSPTIELLPLTSDNMMSFKSTSSFGSLGIQQTFSLGINDKYFNNEVTLTNTGGTTLTDTTFVRHFDPDNTKDMSGSYTTIQKIESTIGTDGAAVVSATSSSGDNYYNLTAKQSKIIYYTTDERAIVGFDDYIGVNADPYWYTNVANMVAKASSQVKDYTLTEDGGMGVIFQVGSLGTGASTNFSYLTSLDNRDMSTILSELNVAALSRYTPSIPPAPSTAEQTQQVNNIVTTIVNSTTVKVPEVEVNEPRIPLSPTNTTQAEYTQTALKTIMPSVNGESFSIVGSSSGEQPVKSVSMEEIKTAMGGTSEVRVPLANGSLIELVNGGLNLPVGVSQEFYVVNNSNNSSSQSTNNGDDDNQKTKKN